MVIRELYHPVSYFTDLPPWYTWSANEAVVYDDEPIQQTRDYTRRNGVDNDHRSPRGYYNPEDHERSRGDRRADERGTRETRPSDRDRDRRDATPSTSRTRHDISDSRDGRSRSHLTSSTDDRRTGVSSAFETPFKRSHDYSDPERRNISTSSRPDLYRRDDIRRKPVPERDRTRDTSQSSATQPGLSIPTRSSSLLTRNQQYPNEDNSSTRPPKLGRSREIRRKPVPERMRESEPPLAVRDTDRDRELASRRRYEEDSYRGTYPTDSSRDRDIRDNRSTDGEIRRKPVPEHTRGASPGPPVQDPPRDRAPSRNLRSARSIESTHSSHRRHHRESSPPPPIPSIPTSSSNSRNEESDRSRNPRPSDLSRRNEVRRKPIWERAIDFSPPPKIPTLARDIAASFKKSTETLLSSRGRHWEASSPPSPIPSLPAAWSGQSRNTRPAESSDDSRGCSRRIEATPTTTTGTDKPTPRTPSAVRHAESRARRVREVQDILAASSLPPPSVHSVPSAQASNPLPPVPAIPKADSSSDEEAIKGRPPRPSRPIRIDGADLRLTKTLSSHGYKESNPMRRQTRPQSVIVRQDTGAGMTGDERDVLKKQKERRMDDARVVKDKSSEETIRRTAKEKGKYKARDSVISMEEEVAPAPGVETRRDERGRQVASDSRMEEDSTLSPRAPRAPAFTRYEDEEGSQRSRNAGSARYADGDPRTSVLRTEKSNIYTRDSSLADTSDARQASHSLTSTRRVPAPPLPVSARTSIYTDSLTDDEGDEDDVSYSPYANSSEAGAEKRLQSPYPIAAGPSGLDRAETPIAIVTSQPGDIASPKPRQLIKKVDKKDVDKALPRLPTASYYRAAAISAAEAASARSPLHRLTERVAAHAAAPLVPAEKQYDAANSTKAAEPVVASSSTNSKPVRPSLAVIQRPRRGSHAKSRDNYVEHDERFFGRGYSYNTTDDQWCSTTDDEASVKGKGKAIEQASDTKLYVPTPSRVRTPVRNTHPAHRPKSSRDRLAEMRNETTTPLAKSWAELVPQLYRGLDAMERHVLDPVNYRKWYYRSQELIMQLADLRRMLGDQEKVPKVYETLEMLRDVMYGRVKHGGSAKTEAKEVGVKREEDPYIRRPSYWNAVKWIMDGRKVQDIDRFNSDIRPQEAKEKNSRWKWGWQLLRKCLEKLMFRTQKTAEPTNPKTKITLEWKRLILRRNLDKAKGGIKPNVPAPNIKGKGKDIETTTEHHGETTSPTPTPYVTPPAARSTQFAKRRGSAFSARQSAVIPVPSPIPRVRTTSPLSQQQNVSSSHLPTAASSVTHLQPIPKASSAAAGASLSHSISKAGRLLSKDFVGLKDSDDSSDDERIPRAEPPQPYDPELAEMRRRLEALKGNDSPSPSTTITYRSSRSEIDSQLRARLNSLAREAELAAGGGQPKHKVSMPASNNAHFISRSQTPIEGEILQPRRPSSWPDDTSGTPTQSSTQLNRLSIGDQLVQRMHQQRGIHPNQPGVKNAGQEAWEQLTARSKERSRVRSSLGTSFGSSVASFYEEEEDEEVVRVGRVKMGVPILIEVDEESGVRSQAGSIRRVRSHRSRRSADAERG